ncbi:MAG: hypothetical protein IKO61_05340 [Lachnospiraceae bacterium]|nr:hypothetical protein [Lachnospiraceae bacterium]
MSVFGQTNMDITNKNIEKYLANDEAIHRYYYAPTSGKRGGWVTAFGYPDRTYNVQFVVDEVPEVVYIEMMIGITCPKPYRGMLCERICEINAYLKSGNIRLEKNGSVYIHISQFFKDNPIEIETIREMEHCCIGIAQEYADDLQAIAGGRFPEEKEENESLKELLRKMKRSGKPDEVGDDSLPFRGEDARLPFPERRDEAQLPFGSEGAQLPFHEVGTHVPFPLEDEGERVPFPPTESAAGSDSAVIEVPDPELTMTDLMNQIKRSREQLATEASSGTENEAKAKDETDSEDDE